MLEQAAILEDKYKRNYGGNKLTEEEQWAKLKRDEGI